MKRNLSRKANYIFYLIIIVIISYFLTQLLLREIEKIESLKTIIYYEEK
jgi:hypothetical protein